MNNIHLYIGLLLVFVLSACTREVQITYPYGGPTLVVYGEINPLTGATATVSSLVPVLTSPDANLFVNNATVLLIEDSIVIDTLDFQEDGHYQAALSRPLKVGHSYSLRATATGFPVAESMQEPMPAAPTLTSVVVTHPYPPEGLDSTRAKADIMIQDKSAGAKIYYFISCMAFNKTAQTNSVRFLDAETGGVGACGQIFQNDGELLLPNDCFWGKETTVSAFFNTRTGPADAPPYTSFKVQVDRVSPQFVQWYTSPAYTLTDIEAYFSEALPPVTNVTGGYGFVKVAHGATFTRAL